MPSSANSLLKHRSVTSRRILLIDAVGAAGKQNPYGMKPFNRLRSMGRQPEPGVDDDRHIGIFNDDFEHGFRPDALSASDLCAERHDRMNSDILQAFRKHGVRIDVGQDNESFFDEDFRRFESFNGVGQQMNRVRMDFQFDPLEEIRNGRF